MGFRASNRSKFRRNILGFTIAEVTVAGCVLALFIATSVAAMTQINRWASGTRYRTIALALAQDKVDQIMTTSWETLGTVPTILVPGTTVENNLPLNNDPLNSETGLSSAFTTLDTPVNATRTTVISTVTSRQVNATVTVSYSYRNRSASIVMTTLRTTDDF